MNWPDRITLSDTQRPVSARLVIALWAIVAVLVLGVFGAAHCGLTRSGPAASGPQQPVLAAFDSAAAITVDQLHPGDRPATACHKAFAVALLPAASSTALAGLGVMVALVAIGAELAHHAAPTGRGPPRGPAATLTGRDRLTRFCLARC